MEQRGHSLASFSSSDVFLEKPFPTGSKNRTVKIHSESLEVKRRIKTRQISGSLEVKLDCMVNTLKYARTGRRIRWDEFVDVIHQLEDYSSSLSPVHFRPSAVLLSHKPNLSLKRLSEMKYLLKLFQKDKKKSTDTLAYEVHLLSTGSTNHCTQGMIVRNQMFLI